MGLENCCCLAYHLNGNEKVFCGGGGRHKGNIWKQLSLWSGVWVWPVGGVWEGRGVRELHGEWCEK